MNTSHQNTSSEFENEYQSIKTDIKSVIIINALILIILIGLYFFDKEKHIITQLANKLNIY